MILRRDPSFGRMAFVSLLVHAAVILVSGLTFSFQARRYVTPNPYFVNLVASSQPAQKTKKKPGKIAGKTTRKISVPIPAKKKKPKAKKAKKVKKKPATKAEKKPPAVKPDRSSALRSDRTKRPEPEATESPEEMVRNKIERLKKIDQLERLKSLRASIGGYKLEEEGASGAKGQKKTASPEAMAVYYGIIRYRVLERWVYTGKAIGRLEAEVLISLSKQGGVQKQSIVKSSGNPDFDRSVLRAIAKASPFPPPPEGVDTEIQFRFRPEDIQ